MIGTIISVIGMFSSVLYFLIFYLKFSLLKIQMLALVPAPPPFPPPPASKRVLTHPLLPPCPGIPLHWGIEPSQDQTLDFKWVPDNRAL